MHESFDLEKF